MARTAWLGTFVAIACVLAASALAGNRSGTPKSDRLVGTKGADTLKGRGGGDLLVGKAGRDVLIGGRGPDRLRGGPGRDAFNMRDGVELPSPGNDRIYARDGAADEINCGKGYDVAIVDLEEDGVYDCEVVEEPSP